MSIVFKRYQDIDDDYRSSDMHMHSTWSDGKGSPEDIISKATEIGLKRICITDHLRRESTYYQDAYHEICKLRSSADIEVYTGFEAKIEDFNGNIDASTENLKLADLSIASVHRFPIGRKLLDARDVNVEVANTIELELSIAAINKGGFSVLGHPGGMSIRKHGNFPIKYFEEIIAEISKTDIAFDFNASYHTNYKIELLKLFETYNPFVAIGSDAHVLDKIGSCKALFLNE